MLKLKVKETEKAIGIPVEKWVNRCHEISTRALAAKIFSGSARYGHYYGAVSENCPIREWKIRADQGIPLRHGWIQTEENVIIDPTRWVFEGLKPYIAVIFEHDAEHQDYDAGGQRLELAFVRPPPLRETGYDAADRLCDEFEPQDELLAWCMGKLQDDRGPPFTCGQVFWLANLPISLLDEFGKDLYQELIDADLEAAIPVDNLELIMGTES